MRRVFVALLGLGVCAAASAVPVTADFGYTVDENGGYGIDADFSLAPTERLTLSAGVGRSSGAPENGGLDGTLLSAAASLHGERAGLSLGYDRFDDSSNYQAGTIAARGWIAAGDFRFALLGRRRDMGVELTLQLPLRTLRREVDFSATGAGVEIGLQRDNFSAYIMSLKYDYDDGFDDFMALVDSPQLADRPRVEALVASFISQAQGVIDRQAGAGCEFAFGRNSLAVDLSWVHDAVLDADSTSLSVGFNRAQSAHVDWGLTAGLTDSDTWGDIAFVGFRIGFAN